MTKAELQKAVGSFPTKKILTEKLGVEGWIIYRDPQNGVYLMNEELGYDINTMYWNLTIKTWNDKIRRDLIYIIEHADDFVTRGYVL